MKKINEKISNTYNAISEECGSSTIELINDLIKLSIEKEQKRIYDYIEERLLGADNKLLKDLANITFNKTINS